MAPRVLLCGADVVLPDRVASNLTIVIEDGRIAAVAPSRALAPSDRRVDLEGGLLAPGFIDAQVNGGGGTLFNEQPTPEGARRIAKAHRRHGTTGLLPTVITDAENILRSAVEAITVARR